MKIYTKRGDKGSTSLLTGQSVPKNHLRTEAYGTADELNSFIGLAASVDDMPDDCLRVLKKTQNTLFVIGAQLASEGKPAFNIEKIKPEDILKLEHEIDRMDAELPPLKQFIIPGGGKAAASVHVCRSVCRRAERRAAAIPDIDEQIIAYLNRLSDYFFVLARYCTHVSGEEELTRE